MHHRPMILLALAACGGGESPDPDPQIRTTGEFCLDADIGGIAGQQIYEPDQPVHVRFSVTECLSSSCTTDTAATCSITPALVVDAEASWVVVGGQTACTDDCGVLSATCSTGPLPAGTHVFTFGPTSIELQIPSTLENAPCVIND